MVWLRHHDTEMAAVTAEERAGRAAELADAAAHYVLRLPAEHVAAADGALLAAAAGGEVPAAAWLHSAAGRLRTRKLPRLPKAKRAAQA